MPLASGREYKLFCLKTEMGPGEMVKAFESRFGTSSSSWIGGIIAPFTVKAEALNALCELLAAKKNPFLKSKEKKTFGGGSIRGITVKLS